VFGVDVRLASVRGTGGNRRQHEVPVQAQDPTQGAGLGEPPVPDPDDRDADLFGLVAPSAVAVSVLSQVNVLLEVPVSPRSPCGGRWL